MKLSKKENFLDIIFFHEPKLVFDTDDNGIIELHIENRGFSNRIAQKFFNRPRISYIKLDEYGSFVWSAIDGKKNVYEISEALSEHFGKDAEPVLERLLTFLRILVNQNYIKK